MKRKTQNIILSSIIIILSYGFIAYKIIAFKELRNLDLSFYSLTSHKALIIIFVFLLMPLNLSLEAFKWKFLIHRIQHFTFRNSLKVIFSGMAIGIFTPNRIGEIAGRALFVNKGKRTSAVLITSVGGISQLITTLLFGLIGLLMFLLFFDEIHSLSKWLNTTLIYITLFVLLILLACYFNPNFIWKLLTRFSFFDNKKDQIQTLSTTKRSELGLVLLLSIVRYIVFISQFYLLLLFFNISIPLLSGLTFISLIYLLKTFIPSTTLAELGVRGSLALIFFGIYTDDSFGIILASTVLWFINIAFPAALGSLLFVKNKLL